MNDMRALSTIVEGLFSPTPADKAIQELDANLDPDWGDVVVDTLQTKTSHPQRFDWPIEGDDWVILDQIEASEPGQGYGTMMMEALVAACDRHQCKIFLDANAFGSGLSQGTLVRFYTQFDFQPCAEMRGFANHAMVRYPD